MFDYIIKNCEIFDGSGEPPFPGDVAVKGDIIADIGNIETKNAREIIDGSWLSLAPGFIDVHSHGDQGVLVNPESESKIRQGITTHIAGQCGSSPFPLRGVALESFRESMAKSGLDVDWQTVEEYFEKVEKLRPAANMAIFVGHGAIRKSVIGEKDIKPDQAILDKMREEVRRAMKAGALGMSTGLIYTPSCFADMNEIVYLAEEVAKNGGIYASHIRGEGDTLIEAVKEALEIGRRSGCPVQISHLKASAPRNWGKVKEAIELIEQAEQEGMDVAFDKYPYTAGSTSLDTYLPLWVLQKGVDGMIEHLSDPETRKKIFEEAENLNEGEKKWESVVIISAGCEEYSEYEGFNLKEIAEKKNESIKDTFSEILIKSRAEADIICHTQSWPDTDMALLHRLGLVCTDSGIWAPYGPLSRIKPHPRAYGSFPSFLNRHIRKTQALQPKEAIHKITGQSAKRFGLKARGEIKKGFFADLVLIDWENLADKATYTDPHRYPSGIEGVFVNGKPVLWKGMRTDYKTGRILKKNGDVAG